MTIKVTPAYDATHENISHLPAGQACGYTTGSAQIAWTDTDWAAHPGAVRICQDAAATDHTADVLDVERGAATLADLGPWCRAALRSFDDVRRPGQRTPAIYTSASNVTAVAGRLTDDGVTSVSLWVADWNLTKAEATAAVEAAAGVFPLIGMQWTDSPGFYDISVFSAAWLADVSAHPAPAGPTRHHATGLESLAGVCTRRGVRLEAAIWQTAHDAAGGFVTGQRGYFDHGDMSRHMPPGMPYSLP